MFENIKAFAPHDAGGKAELTVFMRFTCSKEVFWIISKLLRRWANICIPMPIATPTMEPAH